MLSLHFFASTPVLMSSGADNAIKHWAFDAEEGPPRLLRFRSGHAAPPTVVRFYGRGPPRAPAPPAPVGAAAERG